MWEIGYFKYTFIAGKFKFAAFLIADGEYYVTNFKKCFASIYIIFRIQKKKTWLEWNRFL